MEFRGCARSGGATEHPCSVTLLVGTQPNSFDAHPSMNIQTFSEEAAVGGKARMIVAGSPYALYLKHRSILLGPPGSLLVCFSLLSSF